MRSTTLFSWAISLLLWEACCACSSIQLQSATLGNRVFTALPDESSRQLGLDTGRASYVTSDRAAKMYLYHIILDGGAGRWVMSDVLGEKNLAVAYVDSWAIMPTLIHSLDGGRKHTPWQVYDGTTWKSESAAFLHCIGSNAESAFYLDVRGEPWFYSGFFVETGDTPTAKVYSMVANSVRRYLYKVGNNWILSGEIGSTTGEAYVEDAAAESPAQITNPLWNFGNGTGWALYQVAVISGDEDANVLRNLHLHRRLATLPPKQKFFELANGVVMPSIGLGTGGIPKKTASSVLRSALRQGYRLLDLAREFENEQKVARLLTAGKEDSDIPLREEVFIVSKVWPTHLGFHPTTREIYESMRALQTPYIDMYMLHWPACNVEQEWMHCETSEEPTATWRESWHALERAYAEGHVASIGVSNFDHRLLAEFDNFGSVLPHAVQNPAHPGRVDMPVREWCSLHNAVYMPYSTQVNFQKQSSSLVSIVKNAALNHAVSPNAIISRFFHQSGAAITPRSSKSAHLKENLNIHSFALTNDEMKALGWPHVQENSEL